MAQTWDLSITAVGAEAPAAVELMRYLAFLSPDRIPLAILAGLLADEDVPALLAALRPVLG